MRVQSNKYVSASKAWDDAQLQLRQAQAAARRADACVAAHGHFEAPSKRDTLNCGNCMQKTVRDMQKGD